MAASQPRERPMTASNEMRDSHRSGLLVVAAMERELSLPKKKLEASTGVTFHTFGIGARRAYQETRALLETASRLGPSRGQRRAVLLLGFAGAVDNSLESGDLILSSQYHWDVSNSASSCPDPPAAKLDHREDTFVRSDRPAFLEPDSWMRQQAMDVVRDTGMRPTLSPSLTVRCVMGSPERKHAIFEEYSVASVNMEDYWAAAAAQDAGVPFLSVRAILDPANQRLPGYLPSLSASGFETALSALVRPWRFGPLLSLAIQMRHAQNSLAQFALSIIPRLTDILPVVPLESSHDIGRSGQPLQCVKSTASIREPASGLKR